MPYDAVFYRRSPEGGVHEHFDRGTFRATAELTTGPYAAVGFRPMSQVETSLRGLCLPGDPDCDPAVLLPVLGYVSHYKPAAAIRFVLSRLRPGQLRTWSRSLREIADREGVSVAAALVHGVPRANALVELVGDDPDQVDELLLDVVDRPEVHEFSVLHAAPEDVRGFGERPLHMS